MGRSPDKGMFHDVVWTSLSSVAVLLANALLSAMLARRGAVAVFGPYNMAKRLSAGLLPALSLGLTLGVVKFVASTDDPRQRRRFAALSLAACGGCLALVTLAIAVAPQGAARLALGEPDVALLWASWAFTVAMTVNAIVFSIFRGELMQDRANVANVVAAAGIPLAVVLLAPRAWNASVLIGLTAALVLAWNLGLVGSIMLPRLAEEHGDAPRGGIRELMAYSLPRIPSGLASGLLLVVGPWFARRAGASLVSSQVLAALAFAQLGAAAVQALSVVLLPRVSQLHAQGRREDISRLSGQFIVFMLCLCAFFVPVLVAESGAVVRLWLGAEFAAAVPAVQLVVLSIPAVLAQNVLTSVTDGALRRPVSGYAAIAGLAVCVAGSAVAGGRSATGLAAAYVVGRWVAAVVVTAAVAIRFRPAMAWRYLAAILGAGAVLGVAAAFVPIPLGGALGDLVRTVVWTSAALAGTAFALWHAPAGYGVRARIVRLMRPADAA